MAWYNSTNDFVDKTKEVGRSLDPVVAAKNSSKSIDSGLGNNPFGWYHNYMNDKGNQAIKKATGYDAAAHWGSGPIKPMKDAWWRDIGDPIKNMYGNMVGEGGEGYGGDSGGSDIDRYWNERPEYQSIANEDGSIKDPYRAEYAGDMANPESIANQWDQRAGNVRDVNTGVNFQGAEASADMLYDRAFGSETSPWADKLYEQQGIQQHLAEEQQQQQSAQEFATSQDRLGMTGGLEGGARERLATSSNRNEMLGRQNLARQGELQRLGIGINDENRRMDLQTKMPGMYAGLDQYETSLQRGNADMDWRKAQQWSGLASQDVNNQMNVDRFNLGRQDQNSLINSERAINERNSELGFGMDQWKQRGAMLGADAQADAQMAEASKADRPWYQKIFG